jgi:phosphoribosylformimino-5-aminoimidazole carboxamide ribotide isomerase
MHAFRFDSDSMRLIPVIDLVNGVVVRGVGGRRAEYRQLKSCLTPSATPMDVGRALVQAFEPQELYVADLDAICGHRPAFAVLKQLNSLGVNLWVDAGVRELMDAAALIDAGVSMIVIGLETVSAPCVVEKTITVFGSERVVFSIDLRGGQLLGDWRAWSARSTTDSSAVVSRAIEIGVRRLIVLDLADVGEGRGPTTAAICRLIAKQSPNSEINAGAGVRGIDDVRQMQSWGVTGVLIASALHDGRIKPDDWSRFSDISTPH